MCVEQSHVGFEMRWRLAEVRCDRLIDAQHFQLLNEWGREIRPKPPEVSLCCSSQEKPRSRSLIRLASPRLVDELKSKRGVMCEECLYVNRHEFLSGD